MPTGIRLPETILPPDRSGSTTTSVHADKRIQMETGSDRVYRVMTDSPRLFEVQWSFSQYEYSIFDMWWHFSLKDGLRPFDIELLADGVLRWFTVTASEGYSVTVDQWDNWIVSIKLRSDEPAFTDRSSGTDELLGNVSANISVKGYILIPKILRGKLTLPITVKGALAIGARLGGSISVPVVLTSKFTSARLRGISISPFTVTGELATS